MFTEILSAQPAIPHSNIVKVEVDVSRGFHSFTIVGLTDKSVIEARERISGALKNSGFISPKTQNQKITFALAPAHLKKEGVYFDLAMAVGYMIASKQVYFEAQNKIFIGELSMNGEVRSVKGIVTMLTEAVRNKINEAYIPYENKLEAALIEGIIIFPIKNIKEIVDHLKKIKLVKNLNGEIFLTKVGKSGEKLFKQHGNDTYKIDTITDNNFSKRALAIALSGKHHIVFWGPAGSGKTMISSCAKELFGSLNKKEVVEKCRLNFLSNSINTSQNLESLVEVPIRTPHHTASYAGMVGGSKKIGEITNAHQGILLLDEIAEFDSRSLNALRQPLEEKRICIARGEETIILPCDFLLIATMNPCPCGNNGSRVKKCECHPFLIAKYQKKISQPLIDRIPIWVHLDGGDSNGLKNNLFQKNDSVLCGTELEENIRKTKLKIQNEIDGVSLQFSDSAIRILNTACKKMTLSKRSRENVKKVAETIAYYDNKEMVDDNCVLESLQYRSHIYNA